MTGDAITVLRSRGRRLAKVVHRGGAIDDYDAARTFDLIDRPLADLAALARLLRRLARRSDCAVVRGAVADPARARGVRRLLHADPATGELATIIAAPRAWAALDFDHLARPPALDAADLAACGTRAVATLPPEFRVATAIVQATASHAIRPGLRLRLWFWLSRPADGGELKCWLRAAPVDPAVFGAAQLIYTAAPLSAEGARDPLRQRLAVLAGRRPVVSVPPPAALQPPPRPRAAAPRPDPRTASRYAFTVLARAAAEIARAPSGQRHPALVRSALALARLSARGLVGEAEALRVLIGAARAAGIEAAGRDAATETEAVFHWAQQHCD